MSSGNVDRDAVITSFKVLLPTFIVLIGGVNLFFLVKVLFRRGRWLFQNTQAYVMASLALGDILLALFPLTVFARNFYENYQYDNSCKLNMTSTAYLYFYFPFVYGIGLFFLCIELITRKIHTRTIYGSVTITSVIYCAIIWLLGLIIILPLAWAGLDWDKCTYLQFPNSRARALQAVSVIVPSILAAIGFVAVFVHRSTRSAQQHISLYSTTAATKPIALPYQEFHKSGYNDSDQAQLSERQVPSPGSADVHGNNSVQQEYATEPTAVPYSNEEAPPTYYQPPGQLVQDTQPHPNTFNFPAQHQSQSYAPVTYSSNSSGSDAYFRNEKMMIYISVPCYILFMVPFTIFNMAVMYNDDPPEMSAVVFQILFKGFFWLSLLRGVVIPIVWLNSLTQQQPRLVDLSRDSVS